MEWAPCRRRRAVLIFVISSRGSGDTFVYCQKHRETLRQGYGKTAKKHRHGKVFQKRRYHATCVPCAEIIEDVLLQGHDPVQCSGEWRHIRGERAGDGKGMTHDSKICQIINRM